MKEVAEIFRVETNWNKDKQLNEEKMTAIDFTAEVEKRKEDLLADLFSLLEINSERDDSKVDAEHPFGPGPVKALEKFLEIADRDGYPTKKC